MKNYLLIGINIFFIFSTLNSQIISESDVLSEAQKRNISSVEQAVSELNKNGITLSEAEKMANIQGLDLNTFLLNNFGSTSDSNVINIEKDDIVDNIKVDTIIKNKINLNKAQSITSNTSEINKFYGYNIFKNNPFANKDYLVGNIDEGYLLSPGDEIRITVYGDNALNTETKIDLNGNIIFPQLGVFQAAGNSLKTLKSRLKIFLGKFYNGLVLTPQKTFLDVSLTQIRPVTINILGEATTPGPHLVNGLASVLNAIYSAGGIRTTGSLRKIMLYRNNKLIKEFDLYDYITQGNIDSDIRLMTSDIIFIPPRLSSISLEGAVKNPAIYELKESETLEDLINFSGGFPANASVTSIGLSRITPINLRKDDNINDRYLSNINYRNSKDLNLIDGDIVNIYSILSKRSNEVTLEGNANRTGVFSINKFPNLKSLIKEAGKGPGENTYFDKVDIFKQDIDGKKSFQTFNLSSVLNGDINVILDQDDVVRIYSLEEVEGLKKVNISGFGVSDKKVFWRKGFSIFDVLFESTSFEEINFQTKVLRTRLDVDSFDNVSGKYKTYTYSLNNIIELKSTFVKPNDNIRLYSRGVTENIDQKILVFGDVKNPGSIALKKDMVVEDAILNADGFQEYAIQDQVTVVRKLSNLQDNLFSKSIVYKIDLEYLIGNSKYPKTPFYLEDKDVIVVRTPNRENIISTINISGEVKFPGTYSFDSFQKNTNDLISEAGGLTNYANLESTQFFRDNKFLAYNNVSSLRKQKLSPNDQIIIGSILNDVKVSGDGVNFPTNITWQKNKRASYYIKKAGGEKKKIESKIIFRNNGSNKEIKSLFSNPKIYPGDTIKIVKKPKKNKDQSGFSDNFIKIFGFISSALTSILLVTKL
tara:strand:- start:2987 stop:5608 length:2622 start_codon:yes stop_codon:yes gene_type:complete